jgi:hypothetical protein
MPRLRSAVVKLLALLEDLKNDMLSHGNGRGANAVVTAMRVVRRWAEAHGLSPEVDVNVSEPGDPSQRGDL